MSRAAREWRAIDGEFADGPGARSQDHGPPSGGPPGPPRRSLREGTGEDPQAAPRRGRRGRRVREQARGHRLAGLTAFAMSRVHQALAASLVLVAAVNAHAGAPDPRRSLVVNAVDRVKNAVVNVSTQEYVRQRVP